MKFVLRGINRVFIIIIIISLLSLLLPLLPVDGGEEATLERSPSAASSHKLNRVTNSSANIATLCDKEQRKSLRQRQ